MFDRLTKHGRRSIMAGAQEAADRGTRVVSAEHILLALLCAEDTVATRLLDDMGVSRKDILATVEPQVERGEKRLELTEEVYLSPAATRVLELGYAESQMRSENCIGTEQLLIGIIADTDSIGARAFAAAGVDLDRARQALGKLYN